MDNKNVFIALALSMSVLLFWAAFFETPRSVKNNTVQEQKENSENNITPNVNESLNLQNVNGGNPIAATVINNYYNGGGNGGVKESSDETLGQSFNMDLEKFITSYSIMAK